MSPPAFDIHCALFRRAGGPQGPSHVGRGRVYINGSQATVDAKRLNSRWAGIYTSTTGLLFFGTPFRGAGGLSQAEMLQAIQSQYEDDQIQASTLNILAPGNKTLGDLLDLFFETRQERNLARVACFFEQKPSNVGAILGGPRMNVSATNLPPRSG